MAHTTTADYFRLEWRPSTGAVALICDVDEIPLDEVGHAEDQLREMGALAARITDNLAEPGSEACVACTHRRSDHHQFGCSKVDLDQDCTCRGFVRVD